MLITEALMRYETQLRADGRSPHTTAQVHRHVLALARWAASEGPGCELEQLDHEAVAAFLASDAARRTPDGRPKKPGSLNALRSSVRSFLRHCHDAGYLRQDPGRLIRRARCRPGPPRGLSPVEQDRLLAVLAEARGPEARRDRVLIHLLLATGARLGEALGLDVEDLDLERAEASVRSSKNGSPGTLWLRPELVALLEGFLAGRESGPLFRGREGARLSARHARRRLDGWFQKAGIRGASPHACRHAFGLGLYEETGDLLVVRAALRHASLDASLVYARASVGRVRTAVVAGGQVSRRTAPSS